MEQKEKAKVYTVSEITKTIKSLIRNNLGNIWLEGEISNLKIASSGHVYLTLKDEFSQITTAVFKNVASKLKFNLEDGQKVLVSGEVTIYEKNSTYQIIANYIEPQGKGALQLAFEQLKQKLMEQGLFSKELKKQIPFLPSKIGVITSPTGAAIRDILDITGRRCQLSSILIYPVKVQGDGSAEQIVRAIEYFNKHKNVDVLIVGRGGGSIEDLWAFNEEIVAMAIAKSDVPVVSAVGHEVDFTISDFVSDLRAPTPSAAAELVVPDVRELKNNITNLYKHLTLSIYRKIEFFKSKINSLASHYIFRDVVRNYIQIIDDLDLRLRDCVKYYLKDLRSCMMNLSGKLDSLSPLKVLERGYSVIVDSKNNVIKKVKDVKIGQEIKTILRDGEILAEVKNVREDLM